MKTLTLEFREKQERKESLYGAELALEEQEKMEISRQNTEVLFKTIQSFVSELITNRPTLNLYFRSFIYRQSLILEQIPSSDHSRIHFNSCSPAFEEYLKEANKKLFQD